MNGGWRYLIVNADDYGYFDCVSRGIRDAWCQGIVTATGIFANSSRFRAHMEQLSDIPGLDLGVHLNLTEQAPLTRAMEKCLSRWNGHFPGKFNLVGGVLAGTISLDAVRQEWQAQVVRCLDQGLKIRFLNSHEHIHMLPPLFRISLELADEYAIQQVRLAIPETTIKLSAGALIRDGAMKLFGAVNRRRLSRPAPAFLGMGKSGRLDVDYLKRVLPTLESGQVYELMCHPGRCDPNEIDRPRLLEYHDWQGEFHALTNPEVKEMLSRHKIRLTGYRHLVVQDGRLTVRDESPS